MATYLKRYYWAIILGFIATSSLLVTGVINTFVGVALEPMPLMADSSPKGPLMPVGVVSLDVVRVGHLFGIEPPPPPPPTLGGEDPNDPKKHQSAICMDCAPVKTNMRLQLLATMVASDKHWSMALISDLDKQSTQYYTVGEKVKNCTITDIIRDPQRVVVINEETNRLEYIDGVPGGGAAVNTAGLGTLGTAPVADENGPSGPDVPVEGIKKLGANKYEISKAKLDATLSNLNDIATQARIVPSFKDGQANGFKLFSIRPGSLYSAIGIQNGDVISRINGYDMNSPDKALEIYTKLKDARNIKIDYERHGATMSSDYTIQ